MERKSAQTFEDLIVWRKAHQFVLSVYQYTSAFPREEIYGLTSQFRRAAISIAANIAEGFKKKGFRDKGRFFNTSQGSVEECRYYLILSKDLNYGENQNLAAQLSEVSKLLHAYSSAIQNEAENRIQETENRR
ncbi:MAG TPA: four helix bundle protein [Chitinophagales bacterium]|nr:four helix bundle protein [Chitinophagales bacterium]